MDQTSLEEAAGKYGLTVEAVAVPENGLAYKVYKGAKQIFIGTDEAVHEFLSGYGEKLPGLFEGSMIGYKE